MVWLTVWSARHLIIRDDLAYDALVTVPAAVATPHNFALSTSKENVVSGKTDAVNLTRIVDPLFDLVGPGR
jgi:hypothetical protein